MDLIFITTVLLVAIPHNSGQTINPCALPSSCFAGERAGYPGDCQTYYECSFLGAWTTKTCVTGTQFDSVSLTCVSTGLATCQPPCDLPTGSTTTVSTLAPKMCDFSTSGSSCSNQGDRVADVSNCQYYFQCLSSTWNRIQCSPSGFIFDIDSGSCVPASQAECNYRCKTPVAEQFQTADITSSYTEVDLTSATTDNNGGACSNPPLTVTDYSGVITSPNYPNYYYNYANCQWRIISAEPNGVVVISFQVVNTYPYYDFITVLDGYDYNSPYIVQLTGYDPPRQPYYVTSQIYMFVQFTSSYFCCYQGFYATFNSAPRVTSDATSTEPTTSDATSPETTTSEWLSTTATTDETTSADTAAACSPDSRPLELDGYSGTFVSPNYPGNYFNDANCQWIITAVVQTAVVTLDFEFFSTESCCDFVELHDGDNGKAPSIVTLSGFLAPPPGGFNSTQRNMFIRFTTDSTITDRGFSAVYSSEAPGDPCSPASRPLELIGYSGSFTSSNYPSDYYDNSICQWRIVAAENSGIVELSFNSFNTESCCDIVDIHDGDIAKSPLITSLSGDYNPPPGGISSSQRYMFVSFVTDATDTSRGFSAAYTNADPCSPALQPLQLKAPTGTFTSSNYPSNYDNNADCQWLITAVRPNAIILVNFTDFNTESCCDAVSIYNGDSLKAPLIVKLSGSYTTLPGGYESTQQFMYVRFVTDDSINNRGFKATYTSEGPGDACSPADRPLDLTGNSGTLTSSNYPSNYDNEADCQWRITAVNTIQVVILDFTSFDTESCCDKVNIYNGDSNKSPLISTLSGLYQTPPTGITTTQMYMFVRFTSDDTVTGRGFQASYRSAVSN